MAMAPCRDPDITGNARFRRTLLGRLVLEIECYRYPRDPAVAGERTKWRAAHEIDLEDVRKARKRHGLEPLL
jgi:hypothetical protein